MEHEGFLRDIWEHPDDDTPRLVYADWLEENGKAARAEFIRVQCERERLPLDDPRRDAFYQREQELLKAHGEEWKPVFLKPLGERAPVSFERGLPDYTIIKEAKDGDLLHLIGHMEVRKLLFLEGQGITDTGLVHLLGLPYLEVLGLDDTTVTDEGMRIVARLPRLREVGINRTRVTDAGVLHLHEAPRLAYIWREECEGITEEAVERWKVRRMQRFRRRSPEERRQEAVCILDGLSSTSLGREGGRITRVDLWQRPVSDADLEYFKEVPEVEEIDLTKTPVTGQGLRHFSGLKALRKLELYQTRVDDLKGLAGLTNLKELGVSPALGAPDERLTDRGTAALRTLTNLEVLALPYTSIGSLTLKRLAGLRLLRDLNLCHVDGISDDGLAGLATLEQLESLDLSARGFEGNEPITDNGLQHLAGLKKLTILNLENQSISDAGLVHLHGLKNLEYLTLRGTQATVQGAEELLAFLPKVSIAVAETTGKPHESSLTLHTQGGGGGEFSSTS